MIASTAVSFVLIFSWMFDPAAAAGDDLRVIAVNTASAPSVSMVVQPPATAPQNGPEEESCTVTIDGEPVATTVSPMASGELSVALVIDTASDLTAEELAAVQSGAIDFLLRLPAGAHTMVVDAGGEPQIVAPLSEHAAEALSAISALRIGGSANSKAGARLAAQSLQSAPPGPRVIIVYARGPGEQDPSVEQLSDAVLQANAVVNVIPAGAESVWPWVVDRTGGVVLPPTGAADIAQSYGRLATMLSEQYLVTFQSPDELPAVAEVALHSGDQEHTTVVTLPVASGSADPAGPPSEPDSADPPWGLILSVASGLLLAVLVVLAVMHRAHRTAHLGSVPAADTVEPPVDTDRSEEAPPTASPPGPATGSAPRRSPGSSLSAAVQGRRSARHDLDQQSEQARQQPPDDE